MNNFGDRLRELRGSRTQAEVAEAVGISTSAYASYEQGVRIPKDNVKIKLAKYYRKSVSYIFFS